MTDDDDAMDELDVDTFIEFLDWPGTPAILALQGYKGTFDERKATLIAVFKLLGVYKGSKG